MSNDERLDRLDYYTLLGVKRDASVDDIKIAFRTFARRYHPDRFAGQDGEKVERATRIYRRGSEAVQTLTNLDARRAYDAGLDRGELRLKSDARAAPAAEKKPQAAPAKPTLQSPTARAFFAKAQDAARAGDLQTAWKQIKAAMQHEPGSAILEQALEKVERAMRGW